MIRRLGAAQKVFTHRPPQHDSTYRFESTRGGGIETPLEVSVLDVRTGGGTCPAMHCGVHIRRPQRKRYVISVVN